ncbi:hypothetical protein APR41_02945 [Salegentibacter salinarum]|uniref:Uncharacterized protein n=1 Tax=Salegentibacter salinarum TaxID=447422 RepID=A0A2N0TY60_9FLAO|nr:hypothetical protein [Salegentibacter salinarum]PKD19578.1 hypothetical protein APR41_02945 [Salegentibacter salinarum]SKB42038.1 hypothetical protein SAMN05660903_00601 [Salegentibacter salinarum]
MPLPEIWFPFNKDSDVDNVVHFLEELPANIKSITDPDNSNFYEVCLYKAELGIDRILYEASLKEATEEFLSSLDESKENWSEQNLRRIGFSGESLILKAKILDGLWKKMRDLMKDVWKEYIDFTNDTVVKWLREFLAFLNSILGSLKTLIPGIDSIKESKEIMETFISITEK